MVNIKNILHGEYAFYNKNYEQSIKEEFEPFKAPEAIAYQCDFECKAWRIFKDVASVIIFPIGIARLIHALAGVIFVPACIFNKQLNAMRPILAERIVENRDWKVKWLAIQMDGFIIDAVIMGKPETFDNGRWTLVSGGNGEFYEQRIVDDEFKTLLTENKSNALLFNYSGVGGSTGMPNRELMAKAYRAMLKFLEDDRQGIGAKEIIGYGHSIGGGVQGEALLTHIFKEDVKYVFVKSRSFCDLRTTAKEMIYNNLKKAGSSETVAKVLGLAAGFFTWLFGWNMCSLEFSKALEKPEIVMQTGSHGETKDDGVIWHKASLAHALAKVSGLKNKELFFIEEEHNVQLAKPGYDSQGNLVIRISPNLVKLMRKINVALA